MAGSLPVSFCISLARALASVRRASSAHPSRNAETLMLVGLVLFSAMNLPLGPTSDDYRKNYIRSAMAHRPPKSSSWSHATRRLMGQLYLRHCPRSPTLPHAPTRTTRISCYDLTLGR